MRMSFVQDRIRRAVGHQLLKYKADQRVVATTGQLTVRECASAAFSKTVVTLCREGPASAQLVHATKSGLYWFSAFYHQAAYAGLRQGQCSKNSAGAGANNDRWM